MEFAEIIKTPCIDKAILINSDQQENLEGTLCITTHYLLFSSRNKPDNDDELWLLHSMVDIVEKKSFSTTNTNSINQTINQYKNNYSIPGGQITLKCKDFRQITIQINNNQEFLNAANSIEYLSNLYDPRLLYPFFYRPNFKLLEDGWQLYTLEEEFREIKMVSSDWRISNVNKDFNICSTYPERVIVPKCIEDSVLISISKFRCLGRFPVLSYLHKKNKAAIMRSGQPMVGLNAKRCKEDEKLINSVLAKGKKGYIVETRTHSHATNARNKGGGYELEINYPLWRRVHRITDRQGQLLESLSRFVDACNDKSSSMDKWLNKIENSGWLTNVKDILSCACLIAQCIDKEGSSVLVHGAEGMDSTLQVCCLAQIILEPSMRTIRGFEWLIEKEYTNAGHPFYLRNNKSAFAFNVQQATKEQSPTFLLFLDCVHQLYKQFPNSFEFNQKFLITIFEHSYSSQYGTFLYNCVKQQKDYNFKSKTVSLWSYINLPANIGNFINPTYEPNNRVIWPSVAPQSIVIWEKLFYRWTLNESVNEPLHEFIQELKFKERKLKAEAENLRKQLLELVMNE